VYGDEGRIEDAAPQFHRALEIYEKVYGTNHLQVAGVLSNLASVEVARRGYREAEDLYTRAISIEEKAVGPRHPEVAVMLNNLAQIYGIEGRFDDAEKSYLRAIDISEESLGPAHPAVADCLLGYAAVLRKAHRKKEAGQLEARARQSRAMHDRDDPSGALVDWRELQKK
jgi:tetratricopeptide (TPR) repeat protein